jgi:predicted GNAT family acetyltransferase
VLGALDASAVGMLIGSDTVLYCVLQSRLREAPDLEPRRLGGHIWGLDGGEGSADEATSLGFPAEPDRTNGSRGLRAAVFHGGSVIPVGRDLDAIEAITGAIARSGRRSSSIVGAAPAVAAMTSVLTRYWGRPRAIRHRQPLLIADCIPPVPPDPSVRPVRPSELNRFLPAAVAMFTDELGVSPVANGAAESYRQRVAEIIGAGRAFARFDGRGEVEFKAEIGALSPHCAQIQGVWVRPDLRDRGIGTAGMAAVLRHALRVAPAVGLYVNDFNAPARRMYARLGMRQVDTLTTVLY